jgi:dsRNA-specific ribonuclease
VLTNLSHDSVTFELDQEIICPRGKQDGNTNPERQFYLRTAPNYGCIEEDIHSMKRLRISGWAGQLLSPKARPCPLQQHHTYQRSIDNIRSQSTLAATDTAYDELDTFEEEAVSQFEHVAAPSPSPEAALHSAKLAALHARLSLPKKLPLQTLSRSLIDPSADPNADFNNASMAQIGASLLSYQVSEWLLCTYPRLPMAIMFSALKAYIGYATLNKVGLEWGVESAAAPGEEVDPGLLQFSKLRPGESPQLGASQRADPFAFYRRGMSSRVVYDDEFGDILQKTDPTASQPSQQAMSGFVRAVVGSVYLHSGREAAKTFIKAHVLSRRLDISKLFEFRTATRDLSRLCAREDFEPPVARILSETGRKSIAPVFVVGIFSGSEKLGEGVGPSLVEARYRAAISALKAWYLYSPNAGSPLPMPSDFEGVQTDASGKKKEFVPLHIDLGEIV